MLAGVNPGSLQLEILDPVVRPVVVLMVNDFRGAENPAQMLGHHDPVFARPAVDVSHRVIGANANVNIPVRP